MTKAKEETFPSEKFHPQRLKIDFLLCAMYNMYSVHCTLYTLYSANVEQTLFVCKIWKSYSINATGTLF